MVDFLIQGNQVFGLAADKAIWKWQTVSQDNSTMQTGFDSNVRTMMYLRKYTRRKLN